MSSPPHAELFPRELRTGRLRLVAADTASVDPFELYEHCREGAPGIDEVTRYLTWEPYGTVNEAFEFLESCESDFEAGEAAHYAVFADEDEPGEAAFAGMAGLGVEWDRRLATLGTWLRKPFWGRGYSGERADAMLELAFDRLDLEYVAVTHEVGNRNSRRAVERYVDRNGGRREATLRNWAPPDAGEVPGEAYYAIAREAWFDRRATE